MDSGKQHQYSIIKSHEGAHVLSHPKEDSPLHQYITGLNKDYFTSNHDSELSARGNQ